MFYDFNFKHATLMINISYKDLLLTLDHKYYDAGSLRIVSFFLFLGYSFQHEGISQQFRS